MDSMSKEAAARVMAALVRAAACGADAADLIGAISCTGAGWCRLVASHEGDSSVGIPGDTAVIQLDLRGYAEADKLQLIEEVKDVLALAFSSVWGHRARVNTMAELQADCEEADDACR